MPDNFDPDGYFLGDMSSEEKDALIQQLSMRYDGALEVAVGLHNAMTFIGMELSANDVLGRRGAAMRIGVRKMEIITAIARNQLGIDMEQVDMDAAFEDIVSGMNFEEGDDEPDESAGRNP